MWSEPHATAVDAGGLDEALDHDSCLSAGIPAPVSLAFGAEDDPTAGRRELERVLEQIAVHPEDPRGVELGTRPRRRPAFRKLVPAIVEQTNETSGGCVQVVALPLARGERARTNRS